MSQSLGFVYERFTKNNFFRSRKCCIIAQQKIRKSLLENCPRVVPGLGHDLEAVTSVAGVTHIHRTMTMLQMTISTSATSFQTAKTSRSILHQSDENQMTSQNHQSVAEIEDQGHLLPHVGVLVRHHGNDVVLHHAIRALNENLRLKIVSVLSLKATKSLHVTLTNRRASMTNERQGIEALAGTTGKAKKVSEKRKEMAKVVTEAQRGKILVLFVFAVSDGAWLY